MRVGKTSLKMELQMPIHICTKCFEKLEKEATNSVKGLIKEGFRENMVLERALKNE